MRRAKSYSIIDHEFLHKGYFEYLSHEALVLYFFLLTVSDLNGRSYYAAVTITSMLRLNDFESARKELLNFSLIEYQSPYYYIRNFYSYEKNKIAKELKKKQSSEQKKGLQSPRDILKQILTGD
jgi:hypothetical protein